MTLADEYEAQDAWRAFDQALDGLPLAEGGTVLDLGCGPGVISARFVQRGMRVIGIDHDEDLLRVARTRLPGQQFLRADLRELAALDLPPADGLWCSFTMAYFPDIAPVLRSWADQIKRGGWVALMEVNRLFEGHSPLPPEVHEQLTDFWSKMRAQGLYDTCMGGRVGAACHAAGLPVVREQRLTDAELAFQGAAHPDVLAAWKNRFARLRKMRAELGDGVFERVAEAFLECLASEDHRSDAEVVYVIARVP